MDWKRIGKALLFPPMALLLLLLPAAIGLLIYAFVVWEPSSVPAILSYVLSAYTLTVWCVRIPALIRSFTAFKAENKYAKRWLEDAQFRVIFSLYSSLLINTVYAVFQLCLGIYHRSFWFYSLAAYYICLGSMRFALAKHTVKYKPGEKIQEELRKYRACGIVFLVMNLALSLMIFFMVYWNRTFHHHQITTIAMAAYTFTSLTFAIINMVKYHKSASPVYTASKAISLAAACVSLLTLESTMLTTFGEGTMDMYTRRIFLGTSGGAISIFIITMAVYMIIHGKQKLPLQETEKEQSHGEA